MGALTSLEEVASVEGLDVLFSNGFAIVKRMMNERNIFTHIISDFNDLDQVRQPPEADPSSLCNSTGHLWSFAKLSHNFSCPRAGYEGVTPLQQLQTVENGNVNRGDYPVPLAPTSMRAR